MCLPTPSSGDHPLLSLSETPPTPPRPFFFSPRHNIVFISPLRLNPSLPVRCGKRHFENEIGYINSSAITLAIAFPLYSSSETWLTSTTTPTFPQNAGVYVNLWDWPLWCGLTGCRVVKETRRITFLFIWSSSGRRFLLSRSWGAHRRQPVGCNKWSVLKSERVPRQAL